jgi:hypothetical protein
MAESNLKFLFLGELSLPDPAACGLEKEHRELVYCLLPLLAELETRDITSPLAIRKSLIKLLIGEQGLATTNLTIIGFLMNSKIWKARLGLSLEKSSIKAFS